MYSLVCSHLKSSLDHQGRLSRPTLAVRSTASYPKSFFILIKRVKRVGESWVGWGELGRVGEGWRGLGWGGLERVGEEALKGKWW